MKDQQIQREFGQRVQFLRNQRGLTQEQLAERVGKTEDTISNIERGFSSTRIETAAMIAEVLDVTLSDLFDLPLFATKREKSSLLKEMLAIALEQDERLLKVFIQHLESISGLFSEKSAHNISKPRKK